MSRRIAHDIEHQGVRYVRRRAGFGLWRTFKWLCTLVVFVLLLHALIH